MLEEGVAQLLQDNGVGVMGTDIFGAPTPDKPDDATRVWAYGGQAPLHVKGQQRPVLEPARFQISTRSKSYRTASERAYRIYLLLTGFSGQLSGVSYSSIRAVGMPESLPTPDEQQRYWFVANYEAKKEVSPLV